jgi:putative DNA primase/helicase
MMDEMRMHIREQAGRFLSILEPNGKFTFTTLPEGGGESPSITLHGTLDEVLDSLIQENAQGSGVFVTVNETDLTARKTENITRVRALFVDLDGAPLEPIQAWEKKPHMIVKSSPGRWHAYWLVEDMPLTEFKPAQQALASKFGGDPKVHDLPRLMRLPGFLHNKHDPVPVVLTQALPDMELYKGADLLAEIVGTVPVTHSTPKLGLIEAGSRNAALTSVAGRLRRYGAEEEDIRDQLLAANQERCDPSLPESEVIRIARSVSRYPVVGDHTLDLNDTANARKFVDMHGNELRFVVERKKWLRWREEGFWEADNVDFVTECAKKTALSLYKDAERVSRDDLRKDYTKHAKASLNKPRLRAMVDLATSDPKVVTRAAELDFDDMLIGVRNGVVDLQTGEFRPALRGDLITCRCGTQFEEEAKCPTFDAFLIRVMGGDADVIDFLQRLVGYSLTGSTQEHRFAFLYGNGANGKSTFLDIIMRMLGDYAVQVQPETLMSRRTNGGANNDLARLVGKRFVISNEVSEGAHLEENLIKQLVGGDVVTARYLFQEHFEFKPKLKLLFAGNHYPIIKGEDEGIWRRAMLVPFVQTIPERERDKQLGYKLSQELPGILNWAIRGCLAWQRDGLKLPAAVRDATSRYREEMDLLKHWIDERCEVNPSSTCNATVLYGDYKLWCETSAIKPLSRMVFARKMKDRGYQTKHMRIANFYQGISIRSVFGPSLLLAA